MMIAFDMRCVGFMMAEMVLQELMDLFILAKLTSFLMKGNDPSCLREFLWQTLCTNSASGSAGLQVSTSSMNIYQCASAAHELLFPNVLKIGPDRPVEPSTGLVSGPVDPQNPVEFKTALFCKNRSSRQLNRRFLRTVPD